MIRHMICGQLVHECTCFDRKPAMAEPREWQMVGPIQFPEGTEFLPDGSVVVPPSPQCPAMTPKPSQTAVEPEQLQTEGQGWSTKPGSAVSTETWTRFINAIDRDMDALKRGGAHGAQETPPARTAHGRASWDLDPPSLFQQARLGGRHG